MGDQGVTWEVIHGDCLDVMAGMDADSVDTIITDPPYGLEFMGKAWDHGVPGVPFWEAALRVAKPGATMLAFGGTRTHHRLMCAIEDAGWEIRDCMMWLYGSGFPKSHDVSKGIDKAAGAERGSGYRGDPNNAIYGAGIGKPAGVDRTPGVNLGHPPATDLARQWDGWGTALKPSFEPILLCRKPLTHVPFDGNLVAETQNLIGGLLCQLLSGASNADAISRLSPSASEGVSVSALMIAAVLHGHVSGDLSGAMDTCRSPEMVSISLSIAGSWNSILGALSTSPSTFTIETATGLTTGLRTLNCLISQITQADLILAASRPLGCESSAINAGGSSTDADENMSGIRTAFAAALASLSTCESSTSARSADSDLLPTIRAVDSVLSHVRQLLTCESGENLRPAWEPIIVAMAPLDGTFAQNAERHGVAGLWIDGARIGTDQVPTVYSRSAQNASSFAVQDGTDPRTEYHAGRFPANVILDEEAARLLDQQSGDRPGCHAQMDKAHLTSAYFGADTHPGTREGFNDSGGASRFFASASYSEAERMYYTAKASRAERNAGLEGPGVVTTDGRNTFIDNPYLRGETKRRNNHPTVKPVALLRYLCRLTKTPTGGVVLDPFAGSGSTGVACAEEGRDFIGIEIDEGYCEIARRRIAAAAQQTSLFA